MTFRDIFKSDFLENMGSVSIPDMVLALLLAFCLGLFIFFVYKKSFSGVMYSGGFGVTLVAMCLITTFLIMAVVSNVVLSLGMVGALSIVRFRTAVKEPLDIAFLFWSIAAGIVLAAGLIVLAVFGSLLVGIVLLLFARRTCADFPYILMVRCADAQTEQKTVEFVKSQVKKMVLKSKSMADGTVELNYEVRLNRGDSSFLNGLDHMDGVDSVVLVSYNGDYMG